MSPVHLKILTVPAYCAYNLFLHTPSALKTCKDVGNAGSAAHFSMMRAFTSEPVMPITEQDAERFFVAGCLLFLFIFHIFITYILGCSDFGFLHTLGYNNPSLTPKGPRIWKLATNNYYFIHGLRKFLAKTRKMCCLSIISKFDFRNPV
jgi:hypothetical protein